MNIKKVIIPKTLYLKERAFKKFCIKLEKRLNVLIRKENEMFSYYSYSGTEYEFVYKFYDDNMILKIIELVKNELKGVCLFEGGNIKAFIICDDREIVITKTNNTLKILEFYKTNN